MTGQHLGWALLFLGLATVALGETPERAVRAELASARSVQPPVVAHREPPRTVPVPGTAVQVAQDLGLDYDFFRYGVYWYIHDDDRWYRARSHRGPFQAVGVRYVPRAILTIPARHWKDHGRGLAPVREDKPRSDAVATSEKPGKSTRRN